MAELLILARAWGGQKARLLDQSSMGLPYNFKTIYMFTDKLTK